MTDNDDRFASDPARELAHKHPDAELPEKGSGAGGALTKRDVERAVEATRSTSSPAAHALAVGRPILSSGSDGPAVLELADLLAKAGHESSISRGENHFGILDSTVLDAVRAFRAGAGVAEDVGAFGNDADNHVGPATWEALLAAAA